ncbi:MAG: hypothetical protein WAV73_04220 [Candidatus Moraniibacteriota bacterium]
MAKLFEFPGPKKSNAEELSPRENKDRRVAGLNLLKLTEVFEILNALKCANVRSFGQDTIDKKRDLVVSGYSDNELIERINNYSEDVVVSRPSFYGAIIDELKFRNLY